MRSINQYFDFFFFFKENWSLKRVIENQFEEILMMVMKRRSEFFMWAHFPTSVQKYYEVIVIQNGRKC